jgi:hydrogenase maturation protease
MMRAPFLVLGIGNELLGDDGVGIALLKSLLEIPSEGSEAIEFVDGGTQGLALLGLLENRKGLLLLDAISHGAVPGTVHILHGDEVTASKQSVSTAHGSNALELLNAARLVGYLPEEVTIVGIEPGEIKTKIGLTQAVQKAVPEGRRQALAVLTGFLTEYPVA